MTVWLAWAAIYQKLGNLRYTEARLALEEQKVLIQDLRDYARANDDVELKRLLDRAASSFLPPKGRRMQVGEGGGAPGRRAQPEGDRRAPRHRQVGREPARKEGSGAGPGVEWRHSVNGQYRVAVLRLYRQRNCATREALSATATATGAQL